MKKYYQFVIMYQLMLGTLRNKKIMFWSVHSLNFAFVSRPRCMNLSFSSQARTHVGLTALRMICVWTLKKDCQLKLSRSRRMCLGIDRCWSYGRFVRNKKKREAFPGPIIDCWEGRFGCLGETWIGRCVHEFRFSLQPVHVFWPWWKTFVHVIVSGCWFWFK